MIDVDIPGRGPIAIHTVLSDLNGTLSRDGRISEEVASSLRRLADTVEIHVVTSDTLGTAEALLADLPVHLTRTSGKGCTQEKLALLRRLGAEGTCALGNGANDVAMLEEATLSICVLGLEGAAFAAMEAADMVVVRPEDAIGALLHPVRLRSTLRD